MGRIEGDAEGDRAAEQGYLDAAYHCLAEMAARTGEAAADAAERAPGDWDASVAHAHLTRRLATLDSDAGPLCFGRIDEESESRWYIGRRHVESAGGEPVVVDWRAPVAVPFYRATFRDPLGLARRRRFILEDRRLVDLLDEDFDDPASAGRTSAAGLPDPLLAELGRARTGAMRDIVATIAAEQDLVIRAPLDTPLIVQGGPGTGKTAVGLHRAAFLLYEHRAVLERQGVLVLGPNRIFLSYISQVLPSLGETAVVQTTLPGLVPQWVVRGADPGEVAHLKGDARLATVVRRAAEAAVDRAGAELNVTTRWGTVRLGAEQVAGLVAAALGSGGALAHRRARFRRAVAREVARSLSSRRPDVPIDAEGAAADLRADRAAGRVLDRLWPGQSAPALVRSLFSGRGLLEAAASGILSADERRGLRRSPARSVSAEPWTAADLALLDEADAVLTGTPRQYGHVVVDEAQDLSAMALRMVGRRSADGRSLTILGDLAQATAPGSLASWDTAVDSLGRPAGATVHELTTGYRVPARIMELANRVLAEVAPGLPHTASVRPGGSEPRFTEAAPDRMVETTVAEAAGLAARYGSVAVIAPGDPGPLSAALTAAGVPPAPVGRGDGSPHISLLAPEEAKGLEFDAVVVADPAGFLDLASGGGLLYIALTRAVQHLSVVHTGHLPAVLG